MPVIGENNVDYVLEVDTTTDLTFSITKGRVWYWPQHFGYGEDSELKKKKLLNFFALVLPILAIGEFVRF